MPSPNGTEHEKEEQWRKDVRAFGLALVKHWLWWTSATIGSGGVAIWQAAGNGGGRMIPSWVLWLVGTSGIVVACFRAFCDQRRIAEAKEMDKGITNRTLALYYREIDATIGLLKTYRKSEQLAEAGDLFIKNAELCHEIRGFIEQNFGEIEAAMFAAQNDQTGVLTNENPIGFWDRSIGFFTKKLKKLEEIMRNHR